jgi:Xaa-Pro aminopeptidase
MIIEKINNLRNKFKKYKIDGYIVPKNDDYFSEYAKNDRLKKITKFSGSAGLAVILNKKNYLFVDGRYTIQAQQESSDNYKIIEIHKKLPNEIIKNLNLGYDPSLFTKNILKKYFSNNNLTAINHNLIDQIFKFKKIKTKPFFSLDKSVVGESHHSKISKVVKFIKSNNADYLFVSAPENVAWLLNIRGYDSPSSPIPNARLIISKNKKIYLITKKSNAKTIIKEKKINTKYIVDENNLSNLFYQLEEGNFIIDNKSCSILYENIIKKRFKVLKIEDPIYKLKSIKNEQEIKHMIEAHKKDGLALTKFIYWIKNVNKKVITEVDAQNRLEKFRKLNPAYLFPSFNTIAGAGSNGAIVHYRATPKNTKKIKKQDLLLVDSGGQYKFGTTDVTRTICFSKQKKL